MKNNKGLSNIVGTVLIVLLALAAIAIVWSFLSPTFTDTGAQIGANSKCLQSELKPIKCAGTAGAINVTIQNIRGSATKMKVIIEDQTGARIVGGTDSAPQTLQSALASTIDTTSDLDSAIANYIITVAPIVKDENGVEVICGESPTKLTGCA